MSKLLEPAKLRSLNCPPVSVVILTLNEERNIAACLDSVGDFDDVHVLDSGSADRTIEIVRTRQLPLHHADFRGFGQQRNWAIDNIPTKFAWQFHLDADERMTSALAAELGRVTVPNSPYGGYQVPSKLMFAGRWLKNAGQYPAYQVRLFHRERLRFIDYGHGQQETTQHPIGRLKEPIVHDAFSRGLDEWFYKHVRYARREAEAAYSADANADMTNLFSLDETTRRRALKWLTRKLPARYFLRLAYMLLWQRAAFDGWTGLTYAHMIATYEAMIDVNLRLLKHGLDPNQIGSTT